MSPAVSKSNPFVDEGFDDLTENQFGEGFASIKEDSGDDEDGWGSDFVSLVESAKEKGEPKDELARVISRT